VTSPTHITISGGLIPAAFIDSAGEPFSLTNYLLYGIIDLRE